MKGKSKQILWFNQITKNDVALVGGKNANLGEMTSKINIPVPNGFAITALAYNDFIKHNKMQDKINNELARVKDPNDTETLHKVGKKIRELIKSAKLPLQLEKEIIKNYTELNARYVAVRSSATAEDLPGSSFAGQQETYLNVTKNNLIKKIIECFASLYTDRAIFYRIQKGFGHSKVALSVAIQQMINSKAAGVAFSLDVRDGNPDFITIEGSFGLGELVVQGAITPDDFIVRKKDFDIAERHISKKDRQLIRISSGGSKIEYVPKSLQEKQVISDGEIKQLSRYVLALEKHYNHAQDTEWAVDENNKLFIVQTRPETVWSEKKSEKSREVKGKEILNGQSASPGIGSGKVKIVHNMHDLNKVENGDILVTKMTSPDMVPAMKKSAAIVTDEGGITSHAAIVSRELGIPCVVGTETATKSLRDGEIVTIDGSHGKVYLGKVGIKKEKKQEHVPETKTKIYVNMSVPEIADKIAEKKCDGVGLLREEFILASNVKEHPLSMIKKHKQKEFVNKVAQAVSTVAKAFYPRPVVLRLSDFKTNEYKDLEGGKEFEEHEENPMIGWRGCSRYVSDEYKGAFLLELEAVKQVRKQWKNVWIMLPFVRTVDELKKVKSILEEHGLKQEKDLKLWIMAEIPSNIFLADEFAKHVDGFSIGSNDLTQLILGVDRDSKLLNKMGYFDERNEAVKIAISQLIKSAHANGKTVSICGQAPSNYPDFAKFLVEQGIDSISVNPDVFEKTKKIVFYAEKH